MRQLRKGHGGEGEVDGWHERGRAAQEDAVDDGGAARICSAASGGNREAPSPRQRDVSSYSSKTARAPHGALQTQAAQAEAQLMRAAAQRRDGAKNATLYSRWRKSRLLPAYPAVRHATRSRTRSSTCCKPCVCRVASIHCCVTGAARESALPHSARLPAIELLPPQPSRRNCTANWSEHSMRLLPWRRLQRAGPACAHAWRKGGGKVRGVHTRTGWTHLSWR